MQNLEQLFKLMSDETRLRIITLLYENELCVCQITGITDIAQPKVSKALSKLRDLGLVTDRREDKFVFYRLKTDHPLLSTIMEAIIKDLSHYPQLTVDQSRLSLKDTFLSNCSTVTIQ